MSDETEKCPCCGYALEFSRSSHRVVSDQYVCNTQYCWFTCNIDHYEMICAAIKTYDSAKKLAEWVIANPRHTYDCLTHDMLGTGCICGYDDAAKLAKELLGGGNNETQS